ncbi:triose-phosphate isomerase [Malassezia vespertilionis]|uniref:Triosephosphate isomerase n=1 Tax=Malassezia vespertilionis TaxID=2020962 RepID=A0A2N1JFM9_9BASI|nr:triose-phosphate isomerase [Malassezia vespertilionis]PKI85349.1 Tpi1p [Malassezia vespertilionis]WFD04814.1 triose-phosphate isomerase [Malassezia vespertilionis]
MSRTFFVGGNWKMNGSISKYQELVNNLKGARLDDNSEVVIAPPYMYLLPAQELLKGNNRIQIGAQDAYFKPSGAFTGEISSAMLKDAQISWVIIGHSERRTLFHETDDEVAKKVQAALDENVKVILCIGESLEQREKGDSIKVVIGQLDAAAKSVKDWSKVVIAYEPVWAIGTGKVATKEQAQEVHAAIRDWLVKAIGQGDAEKVRIIYGGSVSGANCKELAAQKDIDGFLVGGASLKPEFVDIVNARL